MKGKKKKIDLMDFFGILTEEEGEALEKAIEEGRKRWRYTP